MKKVSNISVPQPGCHLPNCPCQGIIYLFPDRESLVGDILARDGKMAKLFNSVYASFVRFYKD